MYLLACPLLPLPETVGNIFSGPGQEALPGKAGMGCHLMCYASMSRGRPSFLYPQFCQCQPAIRKLLDRLQSANSLADEDSQVPDSANARSFLMSTARKSLESALDGHLSCKSEVCWAETLYGMCDDHCRKIQVIANCLLNQVLPLPMMIE